MERTRATKKRILSAARIEFAQNGIAGARIDSIARAANINKQRIYAHYGNKNQLFEAVLADAFTQLAEAIPLPRSRKELIEYTGRVFDYHVKNPDFNRLLTWEALAFGAAELPHEAHRKEYYKHKMEAIAEAFPGTNRDTLAQLLFELIGLAGWAVLMSPFQRHLHGMEPQQLPAVKSTREFVVRSAGVLVNEFIPTS